MRLSLRRLLPRAADLPVGSRRVCLVVFVLLLLGDLVIALNALAIFCHIPNPQWLNDGGPAIIYYPVALLVALRAVLVRTRRVPWAVLAVGIFSYGSGTLLYASVFLHEAHPPLPSWADALWISFYPCAIFTITAMASVGQTQPPGLRVLLDAVVSGCGTAAVVAAVLLPRLLRETTDTGWARATVLAYPLGDLLLGGLIIGVICLLGWRPSPAWKLMGSGVLLLVIADVAYTYQYLHGADTVTAATNVLYAVAFTLMAMSPWQRPLVNVRPAYTRWTLFLIPAVFSVAALALLVISRLSRVNGLAFWLATITAVMAIPRMGAAFNDVRALAEARHEARTDDLTELPNRRAFLGRLEQALEDVGTRTRTLAVLILDLDHFKQINDTLGHQYGDELLRMIGPRLKKVIDARAALARLGGDEFALVLDPAPRTSEVADLATRMLAALAAPFEVNGIALRVTASLGVAMHPGPAADAEELMRHADVAMYQAKRRRGGFQFYRRALDPYSRAQLALPAELAEALEAHEIAVHYQPKWEAVGRRLAGVEALVRWYRPDGVLLGPDRFLPAAEQAGLSRALTAHVLDRALAQARHWQQDGLHLHVAVNTTVADLVDMRFPDTVAEALSRHGLAPEVLVLEMTETSLLYDPPRISQVIGALDALGIQVALDDFGTGFSSLSHLTSLAVREIKIDRSFVTRMSTDPRVAAIVSTTITLGHELGMRVTAEGVETTAQADQLEQWGCDLLQGFLLGRPVPAAEITPVPVVS